MDVEFLMEKSPLPSVGFIRREFIQVGFSGLLGIGLSDLLKGGVPAQARRLSRPRIGELARFREVGHLGFLDRRVEPC